MFLDRTRAGTDIDPPDETEQAGCRGPIINYFRNTAVLCQNSDSHDIPKRRPTALGPVANTDTKLLIYGLFQKGRVLAQDGMTQVARNVTMANVGFLSSSRYLIHDRDTKFCQSFHRTIEAVGVAPVKLPARSPDLNSFAERWVKSVKEECLSKLILFGEKSLRHALREYVVYYHHERNHQGKENLLLFPASDPLPQSERKVRSRERLGGLLRFYHREAA